MTEKIQFVDGHEIGKATRRLIRSHVMKGKNSGKAHHRTSRFSLIQQPRGSRGDYGHKSNTCYSKRKQDTLQVGKLMSLSRHNIQVYPSLPISLELTPYSLDVMNQYFAFVIEKLFPAYLGLSVEEAKSRWLGVILSDEASFCCSLCVMQACNEFFSVGGVSSKEALQLLSKAFELVNKRIRSDEAISDSTLGIVIMLIVQEQIRKQRQDVAVHYEGLRKMISLRGGPQKLDRNPMLVLKICKMDITYALEYGKPMLFYRDRMHDVRLMLELQGMDLKRIVPYPCIRDDEISPSLREILSDVVSISALLNNLPDDRTLDIITFQEMITSVSSRLIRLHQVQTLDQVCDTEAAYRVGLLTFTMTLFLQHNHHRLIDCEFATMQLKSILTLRSYGLAKTLQLWLMSIGAIWLSGDFHEYSFISSIGRLIRELKIKNWFEFRRTVEEFPWVSKIHDQPGFLLWQATLHDNSSASTLS